MRRRYHTFHMGYYLLEYVLIDDYLARRAAFREVHLAQAREAHRRGDLILAGALAEPPDLRRTHATCSAGRPITGTAHRRRTPLPSSD